MPGCASSTATATSTPTGSSVDADLVVGGARLAGVERILVPGWNVASSRAGARLRRAVRLARRGGRVHPHDAAKVDDAGWARIVAWAAGSAGRGDRRDRPRLRPRLQPDPGPADEPAAEPGARARDRQAGHPPLPLARRATRRAGRPARGAAGGRRRRSGLGRGVRGAAARVIHSFSGPLDYARDGHRPRARGQLLGPRLPARRGGVGRGRGARARGSRLLVETDSPFLVAARRAALAQRTRMGARHRGMARRAPRHDARCARPDADRGLRPDLPESPEDQHDRRDPPPRSRRRRAARGRRLVVGCSPAPVPVADPTASSAPTTRQPRPPLDRRAQPDADADPDGVHAATASRRPRRPAPSCRRPGRARRTA